MTATYTNQPGTRPIDTVRFRVDDRDTIPETDAALSDEEIQYLIDTSTHILTAAAAAADAIAGQYATAAKSKKVGDLEVDYGKGQAAEYVALAKSLRAEVSKKAGAAVYAGGISKSDKATAEADTDRVPSVFTLGAMDNPNNPDSVS